MDEVLEKINSFWLEIVRELTIEGVIESYGDTKLNGSLDSKPVIFVPSDELSEQLNYYKSTKIEVKTLPKLTDDAIFELSRQPGILALSFDNNLPEKYVVPGGRFNEFYGWDSYFIAKGLLKSGHLDLAVAIADHFAFEIKSYGKILNANRPYYLGRTQPPFLTSLAFEIYLKNKSLKTKFISWIKAAIAEYHQVWHEQQHFDIETNLFRYNANGRGIPPEVEKGHFDAVLAPLAAEHNLEISEFVSKYNNLEINCPKLDLFLKHDRAVRESGHDVTTRFFNVCADLGTIDLCCLVYKYETDIARAIEMFPNHFKESAETFHQLASKTKAAANKYLWNKEGYFCDYNLRLQKQHNKVLSPTMFYALWSGLASQEQASEMVFKSLPKLEFAGGLASTSKLEIKEHDSRQWDYPAGWAPHQILAWEGLVRYGFNLDAKRLASKWLDTVCQGYKQSNGAVFEKYDIRGVENPQDVRAEYGNQGSNKTGFGWTNASFVVGVELMNECMNEVNTRVNE